MLPVDPFNVAAHGSPENIPAGGWLAMGFYPTARE